MELKLQNIKIQLESQKLFNQFNLRVKPAEILALVGKSGCGKSTLLNFIIGTLDPIFQATGEVFIGNENITDLQPEKRKIGVLYQDPLLFPHMTVEENLLFGIPPGFSKKDRQAKITEFLEYAEMLPFAKKDPMTLSGGQQARIALMRTLLSNPRALLLDEPFSKLDQKLRSMMRNFVKEFIKKENLPAILVTHDFQDVEETADQVIDLSVSY